MFTWVIYIIKGGCGGSLWRWFVLGAVVDNILVFKYARTQCTAAARSLTLCLSKTVHWGSAQVTQESRGDAMHHTEYCTCICPLLTLNRFRMCTKDIYLSHCKDPVHIERPLTNTTRFVNESNIGMMRSEIVQYYGLLHTRGPPELTWFNTDCQTRPEGPKVMRKRPHAQGDSGSGLWTDRHWMEAGDTTAMR